MKVGVGRRAFLTRWLTLLAVAFTGVSRRLRAQVAPRFRPLARPVVIPIADLTTGRARQFVADAVTLPSAANPNQPIRVTGLVVRTAGGKDPDRFTAVCARCPHEGCDVDFLGDPSRLPPELVQEIGHPVKEPVYICPCHNSTFTLEDGTRMAGPAPRGLYRFRVTAVKGEAIEIGEVEEDVLIIT